MTITPDNFFKIEGWMRTDLNLKGNELMAYALIYSFQTAYNKPFDGSQAYIAEWLGCQRESVNRTLTQLQKKQFLKIEKLDKGYIRKRVYSCLQVPQNISNHVVTKYHNGVLENVTTECDKISQRSVTNSHNIETDIETNLLNISMKEREDTQQVASSPSPEISWDEIIAETEEAKAKEKQKPKAMTKRFVKPTKEEIEAYCKEKDLDIDVEYLYNYYESNGWMVGRVHMKDWKRAVQNWAKREKNYNSRGRPLTMKEKLEDERLRRNQIVGEELYKNEYYDEAWE